MGLKREEVIGDWRKLHSQELHDLYLSTNVIWELRSRSMKWAEIWHMWRRREMNTTLWW
jgi:hypothetical protein